MGAAKQARMAVVEPTTRDDRVRGSELCTRCGLCCTGALHNAAKLDEDEISAATALGLPILERAKPGFALPCPRLAGTVCTIYGNRPRVCGRYRCGLLQQLEAGEVNFKAALAKVETAQELIDRLRKLMTRGMTLPDARALALEDATGGEPDVMQLRLAATAMVVYIDRNFRNDREGTFVRLAAIEPRVEMESDDRANVQKV